MFTAHHEQELAEIKALTYELDQRVQEGLEQLERIKGIQDEALRRAGRRPQAARQPATESQPNARSMDGNGAAPLLAFVHIPKTAGGTVTSMLTAAYSKSGIKKTGNYVRNPEKTEKKISSSVRREGRVSAGHTPYGALREQLPPDTRYMTFLREPVDRVLSHYYRHIRRKKETSPRRRQHRLEMGKLNPDKADSLEEALVEMRLPQISNLATRFLCGHRSPPMTGDLPASALDDAKESLREFAFVGIQERFEESLVLLQRFLGLGSVPYRDRHLSSDRPAVDEIPDAERALIEQYNGLDAELYRFGLGLFEDAVAAAHDGFAADVEALRTRSATAREEEWRATRAPD